MRTVLPRCSLLAAALCLLAVGVAEASKKSLDPAELTNFLLGPEYAQWLVGPIALLATDQERDRYLALREDEAAQEFIDSFWGSRGPHTLFPPSGPKHTFSERAEEADRAFSEGTYLGRRTDRGTIFIVYGPPESIERQSSPTQLGASIEVWNYPKKAEAGLDGKRPRRRYGFRRQGRVTSFFPLGGTKRLDRNPRRPGVFD